MVRALDFHHTGTQNAPYIFDSTLTSEGNGVAQLNFYGGHTQLTSVESLVNAQATVFANAQAEVKGDYPDVAFTVNERGTLSGTGR